MICQYAWLSHCDQPYILWAHSLSSYATALFIHIYGHMQRQQCHLSLSKAVKLLCLLSLVCRICRVATRVLLCRRIGWVVAAVVVALLLPIVGSSCTTGSRRHAADCHPSLLLSRIYPGLLCSRYTYTALYSEPCSRQWPTEKHDVSSNGPTYRCNLDIVQELAVSTLHKARCYPRQYLQQQHQLRRGACESPLP